MSLTGYINEINDQLTRLHKDIQDLQQENRELKDMLTHTHHRWESKAQRLGMGRTPMTAERQTAATRRRRGGSTRSLKEPTHQPFKPCWGM